jgi:diguanylate cyclase (GGDEF)-like protein
VSRLAGVFQGSVALVERGPERWRLVAGYFIGRPLPGPHSAMWSVLDRDIAATHVGRISATRGGAWTSVPIQRWPGRRAALLITGDWRDEAAALAPMAEELSAALRSSARSAGLRRASYRLARTLARLEGGSSVFAPIVEAMATAVAARFAAIAVADPSERRLAIRATYGYPLMLVEHIQIERGEGVFGLAYESGKVLRAPGSAGLVGLARRRPRYRTDSFIALPIIAGDEVLAVVSVADRLDDRAFTRSNVSALCALAAPAALALARERATTRAEAFAHAAAVDAVSGLFNRRYFHARLEEELQRSRRHEIPLALLMIDIDDFKAINDRFGHLAGDAVIRAAADIVKRAVRVFDVCTRFGGEEFAVIMPGSHEESAAAVAERIRARVASYRTTDSALEGLNVTVSIGLAVSSPGMSTRDVISRADNALYQAKRSGKNRVKATAAAADND